MTQGSNLPQNLRSIEDSGASNLHRLGSRLCCASHCSLTGGSRGFDRRRRKTNVMIAATITSAPAATRHTFIPAKYRRHGDAGTAPLLRSRMTATNRLSGQKDVSAKWSCGVWKGERQRSASIRRSRIACSHALISTSSAARRAASTSGCVRQKRRWSSPTLDADNPAGER